MRHTVVVLSLAALLAACPKPAVSAAPSPLPPPTVTLVAEDAGAVADAEVNGEPPEDDPPTVCDRPPFDVEHLHGGQCAWCPAHAVTLDEAGRAFDLDPCTAWSADAIPFTYELWLFDNASKTIPRVVLMPQMVASGPVATVIESTHNDTDWIERGRYAGVMKDGATYTITLKPGGNVRHFRIRTTKAPSSFGWREVQFETCFPRRIIPGSGSCKTDSDCLPVGPGCCEMDSCSSVMSSLGPNCANVGGCKRTCRGPLDCGAGECICHDGRCAVSTIK